MDKNQKILDNMGLVKKIADRVYATNKFITACIDKDDLISAGVEGLMYAVDNHCVEIVKFSTYAWKCIRGHMLIEIYKLHKLPFDKIKNIIKIEKLITKLCNKLQRFPTYDEISKMSNLTEEQIEDLQYLSKYINSATYSNHNSVDKKCSKRNYRTTENNIIHKIDNEKFFDRLSKEAKYVINIVLNCPEEILDIVQTKTSPEKLTKHKIRQFLRIKGWKFDVIDNVFEEIKNQLPQEG